MTPGAYVVSETLGTINHGTTFKAVELVNQVLISVDVFGWFQGNSHEKGDLKNLKKRVGLAQGRN